MFKKNILLSLLMLGACASTIIADDCNSCASTTCASSCNTGCNTSCNNSCNSGCADGCGCPNSGKSYLQVIPMFQSARPEVVTGFRNDVMLAAKDGIGGAFEISVFGGRTTNSGTLGSYFTPFCQKNIIVSEALNDLPTTCTGSANISAQQFNITTVNGNFNSTFSINARQSIVGAGFHYKQGFWYNCDNTRWWYIDALTSVQNVKNKVSICENVINDGGGINTTENSNAVPNMVAAFAQTLWCYGRIDECAHGKTGLSDIELKLGRVSMWGDACDYSWYIGALIPTGNKAKGVNVFEPIVGHGKYAGLMFGSEGLFHAWDSRCDKWHADVIYNMHSLYLFSKTQKRSFDVKGKPWSRYQQVYASLADATAADTADSAFGNQTPGINVFTQCVKVTPGYQIDINSGLKIYNDCGFSGELGYNLFAREAECVKLAQPWVEGPAFVANRGTGLTNPSRDISPNPLLNSTCPTLNIPVAPIEGNSRSYADSIIKCCDLDLQSAATPASIVNMVYGNLGYNWDDMCYPVGLNFGGSYEFGGKDKSVINRWGLWGKFDVAF